MMSERTFRRWLTMLTIVVASSVIYAQNPVSIFQIGPSTVLTTTLPVSGTVTSNAGTNLNTSLLALEAGGNLAAIKAKTDNIPALGQALAAASTPIVLTAAQITTLTPPAAITGFATETTLDTRLGSLTEGAPASDTASSGLNGRLQRIAQRLTSLLAQFGTIGSAPPSVGSYTTGLSSGATGGLVAPLTICDSQGYLDMTTATTTEIAPLVSGRTIRVCSVVAMANGTTVMTFKRGTGTNCGTGTTTVSPAFDLIAQAGWTLGGVGTVVIGPAGAGTAGGAMTSGNALCATSSAAVNLHILINYAVY